MPSERPRSVRRLFPTSISLIDRDIQAESLDAILAPVRRNFEQSGMTDEDLAALVEEVREDIWREKHGRPSKTS